MFKTINQIVSVGSVDGVCTAAAVLRLTGNPAGVGLVFTQAFTVDRIDLATWEPNRQVAFVDLAVDNRDPAKTAGFVAALRAAGHTLVAVIDEHSREDWQSVLGSFEGLIVEPQSQKAEGGPGSSGELLRRFFDSLDQVEEPEALLWYPIWDDHTKEILAAADAGDRMDFTTHFGAIVNSAVKSSIADDSRRVYLARHLAFNREADSTIQGWIAEYEIILANHDCVVAGRVDLGDGIHRVTATGLAVDMTTLMGRLYKEGAKVVALEGESYSKELKRKVLQLSFGTRQEGLDLLAVVKAAVPTASGFAQKANVDPADEAAAIAAIRAALRAY